jgi:hypothetical protein
VQAALYDLLFAHAGRRCGDVLASRDRHGVLGARQEPELVSQPHGAFAKAQAGRRLL